MATTLLQRVISFLKDNAPGVITTWGNPGIPDVGETNWSGVTALEAAVDEHYNVTDGQLEIGKSGAAGLTNPTVTPTLTAALAGSLLGGVYQIEYTFTNAFGETTPGTTITSITLPTGTTNSITVSALSVPAGVVTVKWYISDAPGSGTLHYLTTVTGSLFSVTTLGSGPIPPTTNTTGSSNHPVKGQITGSNGVGITNGPGTIDAHLNVTGDISATAGVVTVTDVQHVPFATTGPTNNQIPRFNSISGQAEWHDAISNVPATPTQQGIGFLSVVAVDPANPIFVGDNDPRFTAGLALPNGDIFIGNVSNVAVGVAMNGDATIAGAGTVTVTKINGIAITGTPATGKIPVATGSTAATWQTPPTAASIQGIAVSATAPTNGQGLVYNSGTLQYAPAAPTSNATQIQGTTVSATAPTITDQALLYNSGTGQYAPKVVNIFCGARVNVTVAKTIPNNAFTKISFDGATFDQTGFYPLGATTKLTVPSGSAGFYLLTGSCRLTYASGGGTGPKQLNIRVNNVDVVLNNVPSVDTGDAWSLTLSTVYQLAAGDYVELVAYQNTGVTMNAGDATGNACLSIARLGT